MNRSDGVTFGSIFENRLSHLKYNKALAKEFQSFGISFINKNSDSSEFWGSPLTGTIPVRFLPQDSNKFFRDILGIDVGDIEDDLELAEIWYELSKNKSKFKPKDVMDSFKVASDSFNLTCMFLIHKFLTSPVLSNTERVQAAQSVALIFCYRILTGLLAHYFPYPANEAVAKATYANLNNKFLLKKCGTWNALMIYRADEMIHDDGIHNKTLMKFNNDSDTIYLINDSQGRIRDYLKNIYVVFIKVHESGERINNTSSSQIDTDGVEVIKDKLNGLPSYISYILSVISDHNSFIKRELIDIILSMMQTTQEAAFIKTLDWICINSGNHKNSSDIEDFVKLTIVHSFDFLSSNSTVLHNPSDLVGLLSRLRGAYVSSRSDNLDLMKLREEGYKLVEEASHSKSENQICSLRTSLLLYIILRTFTKRHYMN